MLQIEDRLNIADLLTKFAFYVDCSDYERVSELFTEDGSYESIRQAKGKANVRNLFKTLFADRANPNKRVKNGLHLCGSPLVEGNSESASALSHFIWVVTSMDAPPIPSGVPYAIRLGFEAGQPNVLLAGMYKDELRKVDGRWLIARRKALVDVPEPSAIPSPV